MEGNGKKLTHRQGHAKKILTRGCDVRLSVSFLYFRQIEHFGLSGEEDKWFVSLLNRLKDICSKDSEILQDKYEKGTYRLHRVNWGQPNIPLKRSDLSWIPKEYLDNEEEFPMWQFAVSTGRGRVIGFFNEQSTVFNIVLLDPKHNMQPSKGYGYKVDKTLICSSEIEELECIIAVAKNKYRETMSELPTGKDFEYIALEKDFAVRMHELLEYGDFLDTLEEFVLSKI